MNKILALLVCFAAFITSLPNTEITTEQEVVNDVISSNASFTDKMYSLMPKGENYMFSPFSVKTALAMAANGADGGTRNEILTAVGIENLDDFNKKIKETISKYSKTDLLRLDISNSVWTNTDRAFYEYSDEYVETVEEFYEGEMGTVTDADAVERVNAWVDESTSGKIPGIISTPDFSTALINAIYFKGKWNKVFDDNLTVPDTFTSKDGTETKLNFMNASRKMPYGELDGVRVVELPYLTRAEGGIQVENASVSMYVLLSDGEIKKPEETVKTLRDGGFTSRKVNLSLPKFKVEYSTELSRTLEALGIVSAFGSTADFSKMTKEKAGLSFSGVIHKTYIEVDEEGTEAAAVTAIMMAMASLPRPEEEIDFKANKPFTFIIMDNISGETLFIGEYAYAK